jgi:hypothetical protein
VQLGRADAPGLQARAQAAARQPAGAPLRGVEEVGALLAVLLNLLVTPLSILVGMHPAATRARAGGRGRAERPPAAVGAGRADGAAGAGRVYADWQAVHPTTTGTVRDSPARHGGLQLSIRPNRGHPVPLPLSRTQAAMSLKGAGLGQLFAIVASVGAAWLLLWLLSNRARSADRETRVTPGRPAQ